MLVLHERCTRLQHPETISLRRVSIGPIVSTHLRSTRHVSGRHSHGGWRHRVAWWGVPIGAVVVATAVGAAIAAVVAAVLVVAAPLRVVSPLTPVALVAVVTGLGLVVVAVVILALAPVVVAHLLAATQEIKQIQIKGCASGSQLVSSV